MVDDWVGEVASAGEGGSVVIGCAIEDPASGGDGVVEVGSAGRTVTEVPVGCGGPRVQWGNNIFRERGAGR